MVEGVPSATAKYAITYFLLHTWRGGPGVKPGLYKDHHPASTHFTGYLQDFLVELTPVGATLAKIVWIAQKFCPFLQLGIPLPRLIFVRPSYCCAAARFRAAVKGLERFRYFFVICFCQYLNKYDKHLGNPLPPMQLRKKNRMKRTLSYVRSPVSKTSTTYTISRSPTNTLTKIISPRSQTSFSMSHQAACMSQR
jgi:hypothetical protein